VDTLQKLAKIHRSKLKCEIIGITGSNGKTTTKELISEVLGTQKKVSFTQGNLNNHIGVPLTILSISTNKEIAVIEMGANHIGEIAALCDISRPHSGLITNIGKAHLEGFGSFEGVIKAKTELYKFLRKTDGLVFVNEEDPLLIRLSNGIRQITYGSESELFTSETLNSKPYLKIKWAYKDQAFELQTQLVGKYNRDNLHAAIAIGLYYGIQPHHINNAIAGYQPENNRSQLVKTDFNEMVLDAYNANPTSMVNAIENFTELEPDNPWLILGDMFELGEAAAEEHQKIIQLLKDSEFKNVLLIGEEFFKLKSDNDFYSFVGLSDAIEYLKQHPVKNAQILIKGSRGVQLEQLIKLL
jgi:UDP-N-acetylmuramoyl-tripeptide--D-alanyl-D-alanine ligase